MPEKDQFIADASRLFDAYFGGKAVEDVEFKTPRQPITPPQGVQQPVNKQVVLGDAELTAIAQKVVEISTATPRYNMEQYYEAAKQPVENRPQAQPTETPPQGAQQPQQPQAFGVSPPSTGVISVIGQPAYGAPVGITEQGIKNMPDEDLAKNLPQIIDFINGK